MGRNQAVGCASVEVVELAVCDDQPYRQLDTGGKCFLFYRNCENSPQPYCYIDCENGMYQIDSSILTAASSRRICICITT